MEPVPAARVISTDWSTRLRAALYHTGRAARRTWARAAPQVLVMVLTLIGFVSVMGLTLVLAQLSITVHPTAAPPAPRPVVIYFMHQPRPQTAPVRAAMTTLGATAAEVGDVPTRCAPPSAR